MASHSASVSAGTRPPPPGAGVSRATSGASEPQDRAPRDACARTRDSAAAVRRSPAWLSPCTCACGVMNRGQGSLWRAQEPLWARLGASRGARPRRVLRAHMAHAHARSVGCLESARPAGTSDCVSSRASLGQRPFPPDQAGRRPAGHSRLIRLPPFCPPSAPPLGTTGHLPFSNGQVWVRTASRVADQLCGRGGVRPDLFVPSSRPLVPSCSRGHPLTHL